jgi:Protein of unknown function (DUF3305)
LNAIAPLQTITVGIVIERVKGSGRWADFLWRPCGALTGAPETPVGSKLSDDGEHATFYAGAGEIELYRTEAANYRENLLVETPLIWVMLRTTASEPPYALAGVTADPAEGEAWASLGSDIVDTIAMPEPILAAVAQFVSEHATGERFQKRKRDRADPDALARRPFVHDENKR